MNNIKYVGLDVHLATIVIAVLDLNGKLLCQMIIDTNADAVRAFFRSISGSLHVTFEEGPMSNWLFDLISPLVAELIVCNPRENDALKRGNKNDEIDAVKLARLLRAGLLKPVFHNNRGVRALKELVRNYNNLVSDCTRVRNRIKALYRARAIRCSGTAVLNKTRRGEWLAKLHDLSARTRAQSLCEQFDMLTQLRRKAKKALLEEARRQPAYKIIKRVPGIGPVRAAEIMAVMITPHRFRTKRQVWPYAGLAVVTRTSGEFEIRAGRLLKKKRVASTRGLNQNYNRRLKYIFKSAAISAIKRDPMKQYYQSRLAKGIRPEMARLTVARKLAAIVLSVWKKGECFDPQRVNQAAAA